MKIGIREIFSTERTKDQFITTEFLFIGLPILPIRSYFVFNKTIETGSAQIPLNRKNILKNYFSVYLSVLAFFLLIFNFFLNENLILSSHINPYYYELEKSGLPLNLIEKLITLCVTLLSLYFIFYFGKIAQDEKEERFLIQKSEFWKTILPGRNLRPILGRFYDKNEQRILMNQLMALLFKLKIKLNDAEKEKIEFYSTVEKINFYNDKLNSILISGKYKEENIETVALIFSIVSIKKRFNSTNENEKNYTKVKEFLLKKTKS